jgi:hypothetical protein
MHAAAPTGTSTVTNWRRTLKDRNPGEIHDFEFTPQKPGMLTLRIGPEDAPPEAGLSKKANVAVRVR